MEPTSERSPAVAATPAGGEPPVARRIAAGCAAVTAALALAWSLRPLAHDDLFWQLRTGAWISTAHAVPTHDPFSFTRSGAPWISHEWAFGLLTSLWRRAFGLAGLLGLTALATAGIAALVVARAAARLRPVRWTLLAPLLSLALLASAHELFLRAAWLATLLLAALLLALERWRATGRRRHLLAAVGVVFVWANVHSNVVFGLGLFALVALEAWVTWLRERWPASRRRGPASTASSSDAARARPLSLAFLAAAAVALCNPNGIRALLYPLVLRRVLFESGIAWDLGMFEAPDPFANPYLAALVVLCLGVVGLALLRRAHAGQGARPWELIATAAYALGSLRAERLVTDLAVIAVPMLYAELGARLPVDRSRRPWSIAVPAALAGLLALAALARSVPAWPPRVLAPSLPVGAARFLTANGLGGRPFHNSNQGGYLGWALDRPVFWDGRNDVFASLTREVTTVDFDALVEHYDVDTLVLTPRELGDLGAVVAGPRWSLVYWDDVDAVYLRRDGPYAAAAERLELHAFGPFSDGRELAALAGDPARRAAARRELDSLLAIDAENSRALYFAAVLDVADGERTRALERLRRALGVRPDPRYARALATLEAAPADTARRPMGQNPPQP